MVIATYTDYTSILDSNSDPVQLDACYLRLKGSYIFQVVKLTDNMHPILGSQVGCITIIIHVIY